MMEMAEFPEPGKGEALSHPPSNQESACAPPGDLEKTRQQQEPGSLSAKMSGALPSPAMVRRSQHPWLESALVPEP